MVAPSAVGGAGVDAGVGVGVDVAVGVGVGVDEVVGVDVGVGVGLGVCIGMSAENSDVLPSGAVAVAERKLPATSAKETLNCALPPASVVTTTLPKCV